MNWNTNWDKIGDLLGSGRQGNATRVVRRGTREIGVIKELKPSDAVARQRMISEVKILSAINHPQIPTVLETNCGADVSDHDLYFITRFSFGIRLDKFIGSTILSTERALLIARRLVEIVRYLHEDLNPPVLHRDIKPQNILIRGQDEPVLIDFGIAFRENELDAVGLTDEGEAIGNQFMLLPERHSARRDRRSDLSYCIGIFFYLLTNAQPGNLLRPDLPGPHHESRVKHYFDNMPLEDVTQIFAIFDRAFAHKLEDRFQSANELLNEIDKCFSNLVSVSAKARLQAVFEHSRDADFAIPSQEELLLHHQQQLASVLVGMAESAQMNSEEMSELTFISALESARELRMIDEDNAELVLPENVYSLAEDLINAIDELPAADAIERVLIWAPEIIRYFNARMSERSEALHSKYEDEYKSE